MTGAEKEGRQSEQRHRPPDRELAVSGVYLGGPHLAGTQFSSLVKQRGAESEAAGAGRGQRNGTHTTPASSPPTDGAAAPRRPARPRPDQINRRPSWCRCQSSVKRRTGVLVCMHHFLIFKGRQKDSAGVSRTEGVEDNFDRAAKLFRRMQNAGLINSIILPSL